MTAARRTIDLATTEAELQQLVVDLAHTCAWKTMHVRPTRVGEDQWATATSIPGWVDLVLLGHGRALFVELKSERGRLRPEQIEVIALLRAAELDARVWTPSSWAEIEETLTGGCRRAAR